MKRRTVLRLAGPAALGTAGGCLSDPGPPAVGTDSDAGTASDDRTSTPQEVQGGSDVTPSPTPASGVPRTVTVEAVDDGPLADRFGVTADVEAVQSQVTREHTARVRVALRTKGQSRTLTYVREECGLNVLFGDHRTLDDTGLVLLPGENWESTRADCWRTDERNVNCGIPSVEETVTVDPDEPLAWTFTVWHYRSGTNLCMPPGRYRLARPFEAGEGDGGGELNGETGTLTFELLVEALESDDS